MQGRRRSRSAAVRYERDIVYVEDVVGESGLVLDGELVDLGLGDADIGEGYGIDVPLPHHWRWAIFERIDRGTHRLVAHEHEVHLRGLVGLGGFQGKT